MESEVKILNEACAAVLDVVQGATMPPGRRTQLQVAYCHLVIEHECAIAHLLGVGMTGSAFSLARPTFEALVKGLWLYHCATDEAVESHARGKELDQVRFLTESLELTDLPPAISGSLHHVKKKYWKTLSSLAHVGHSQMAHWLSPLGVRPNYPEAAVRELANFAAFMIVVAGRELALRANNVEGGLRLMELLPDAPPE